MFVIYYNLENNAGLGPKSELELMRTMWSCEFNSRIGLTFRNTIGSDRSNCKPDSEARACDPNYIENSNLAVFFSVELLDIIASDNKGSKQIIGKIQS